MRKLLLAVALAAVAGVVGSADEGKKGTFTEVQKEFMDKWRAANKDKDEDAKKAALKEYGPKFLAMAEKDAKSADGAKALNFTFQVAQVGKDQDLMAKAITAFKKDHLKAESAKSFIGVLGAQADETKLGLLEAILKENPDKKVQARAAKGMIGAYEGLSRLATQVKDNEKIKANVTKSMGEAFVKFVEDKGDTFEKKAGEYKKMLEDKFAGVIPDLSIGKPVPEVVSKDLDGKEVKLSSYKGKVVVIDVWATWCPPCRAMIPHEREMVKKLDKKPFTLISVSADDAPETVKKFLETNEMPWVHWFSGPDGGLVEDWEVRAFPTIYVIDHKGVIRFKDVRDKKMEEAVEKLLKEMEDEKKTSE